MMTADQQLNELAAVYGIFPEFEDLAKQIKPTSRETQLALLTATGVQCDNDAMIAEALQRYHSEQAARRYPAEIIINRGKPYHIPTAQSCQWRMESAELADFLLEGKGGDGIDLPPLFSGIYDLWVMTGKQTEKITLIAAPDVAPTLDKLSGHSRVWGVNAALYGLRSKRNLGVGDYGDLAQLAEIAGSQGAGFLGVNPLHALGWGDNDTISPYSPTHRGFLTTAHIALDGIPGLEHSESAQRLLAGIDSAGLRASQQVDYAAYYPLHKRLLQQLFRIFQAEAPQSIKNQFQAFCAERGDSLQQFSLFETLSESHGKDWRDWPVELRRMGMEGHIRQSADQQQDGKMQFHAWLQWLADTQLANAQSRAQQAGMSLGLYLDLAVGPRRSGAEAWCEGQSIAQGVSLGAPPDHLSPAGQNWNLAAFSPHKLIKNQYKALRNILAETMRHAGILRIDHVLGMNRSFWIPDNGAPGGYIKQPFESLLAVIAIEAERAQAVVVGEDLGLVPDGFRETMNVRGLYSYSVLQYEKDDTGSFRSPDDLNPDSLACFGTHDTPTLNGFWQGRDIEWWQKLGWIKQEETVAAQANREAEKQALLTMLAGGEDQNDTGTADQMRQVTTMLTADELSQRLHGVLAASPVAMVAVQLDDMVGQVEAQNLPGTIDEHPNWRRKCPVDLADLAGDWSVVGIMAKHGRS